MGNSIGGLGDVVNWAIGFGNVLMATVFVFLFIAYFVGRSLNQ